MYDDTYSRHAVQEWQEIPDKVDILFVSTHQDDELLFFGGAIPYYTHREGVNAAVLYMADCGRTRCREALDGLWTAGVRIYPFFCGLTDEFTMNPDLALSRWEKAGAQEMLVSAIRRCKPDVVVCQDLNGEYGHGQHRATSLMTTRAVALAADATYDAPSAEAYGVWQVKKLYVHLYEQDEIIMDWQQMKLDDTGVVTALFLATEAYDKHRSQQASFSMHHHGVLYDNTRFGLYFTDVGPDEAKNDFLEHITE